MTHGLAKLVHPKELCSNSSNNSNNSNSNNNNDNNSSTSRNSNNRRVGLGSRWESMPCDLYMRCSLGLQRPTSPMPTRRRQRFAWCLATETFQT